MTPTSAPAPAAPAPPAAAAAPGGPSGPPPVASGAGRSWRERHPRAATALLVGVVAVLDLAGALVLAGYQLEQAEDAVFYRVVFLAPPGALLSAVLLLWRHRAPRAVAIAVVVVSSLTAGGFLAALVALVGLATRRVDRVAVAVAAAFVVLSTVLDPTLAGPGDLALGAGLLAAVVAAALGVGAYRGQRRRLLASLRERAEAAERERDAEARRVRSQERTRIAREMHDTLAHRMSLVALHAGGLGLSAPTPEVAATSELIRSSAHDALTELRQVLGVLHDDEDSLVPAPGLAAVPEMLERWTAAGARVRMLPPVGTDTVVLPPAVDRAAFRVVQEAVTNAVRHGGGDVVVTVHATAPALHLEVRDSGPSGSGAPVSGAPASGPGGPAAPGAPAGGRGLLGLAETVRLLGGDLRHGPDPDGGWRVTATLPLPGPMTGPLNTPGDGRP